MALLLDISESVTTSLRLTEPEIEPRLRLELAIALYTQNLLSFGKAAELSGISRYQLGDLLTQREIPRHFTDEDLEFDLEYARSL